MSNQLQDGQAPMHPPYAAGDPPPSLRDSSDSEAEGVSSSAAAAAGGHHTKEKRGPRKNAPSSRPAPPSPLDPNTASAHDVLKRAAEYWRWIQLDTARSRTTVDPLFTNTPSPIWLTQESVEYFFGEGWDIAITAADVEDLNALRSGNGPVGGRKREAGGSLHRKQILLPPFASLPGQQPAPWGSHDPQTALHVHYKGQPGVHIPFTPVKYSRGLAKFVETCVVIENGQLCGRAFANKSDHWKTDHLRRMYLPHMTANQVKKLRAEALRRHEQRLYAEQRPLMIQQLELRRQSVDPFIYQAVVTSAQQGRSFRNVVEDMIGRGADGVQAAAAAARAGRPLQLPIPPAPRPKRPNGTVTSSDPQDRAAKSARHRGREDGQDQANNHAQVASGANVCQVPLPSAHNHTQRRFHPLQSHPQILPAISTGVPVTAELVQTAAAAVAAGGVPVASHALAHNTLQPSGVYASSPLPVPPPAIDYGAPMDLMEQANDAQHSPTSEALGRRTPIHHASTASAGHGGMRTNADPSSDGNNDDPFVDVDSFLN